MLMLNQTFMACMTTSDWINLAVAFGTLALAAVAFIQLLDSRKNSSEMLKESKRVSDQQVAESQRASLEQLGVQTWLHFQERFDSLEMKTARWRLASEVNPYNPEYVVSEEVLDFFEDLGTVYRQGFIDKKLAASSFGYYANYWWEAVKDYVADERKRKPSGDTFYEEFEALREVFREQDPTIDTKALKEFLLEEFRQVH